MKLKFLLPLLAFGLLAALLARGLQLNPREIPSPLIGKPVPAFELAPLHEGSKPLRQADLLGRVSVINVWASWCAPCRQEHPLLVDFAKRQPGIQLLGLNYKDDRAQASQWLKELGNPYAAIGFDAKARSASTSASTACPRPLWSTARARCASSMSAPSRPSCCATSLNRC